MNRIYRAPLIADNGCMRHKQSGMRLDHLQQVARVAIVLPSGVRLASAGVLIDCFERARNWVREQYGAIDILPTADHFDVVELQLLTAARQGVMTEGGARLLASQPLDSSEYDIAAVADHAPEAVSADEHARLSNWLAEQAAGGATIAASGSSVMLAAAAGLLDGHRATGPWPLAERLRERHPAVDFDFDTAVVEDGGVLTSAGAAADFDLAVRLVEAVTSANVAFWLRRVLRLTDARTESADADPLLLRAQHWLADRFSRPIRIDDLAQAMQVSRRTLHRHFLAGTGMTPIGYLQALRIGAAKRMLERTGFSVERIAALVGYGDTAFFREAFRREAGMTPRRWRFEHGLPRAQSGTSAAHRS